MSTNIRVINETFTKEYEYEGLHISIITNMYPILDQIINSSNVVLTSEIIKDPNVVLDNQEGIIHWIYKEQSDFIKDHLEIKFYKHTNKKTNVTRYLMTFNIFAMKHEEFETLINHCIDKFLAIYNEIK